MTVLEREIFFLKMENFPLINFYKKRNVRMKIAGKLLKETVQMVYEDNIKKYGTLTCYLCLKSIIFGADHLEHKTPIARRGTNKYDNLAIACVSCNLSKKSMTESEFRHLMLSKSPKMY